ncbi:MAG TPA: hypothetical protein VGL59_22865 [Polyangia bacterium]|jgi:hypothetical protein
MSISPAILKIARPVLLLVAVLASGAVSGCAYSGITSTPDGTVVVARNSLLGANRKIYICKVSGETLKCVDSQNAP